MTKESDFSIKLVWEPKQHSVNQRQRQMWNQLTTWWPPYGRSFKSGGFRANVQNYWGFSLQIFGVGNFLRKTEGTDGSETHRPPDWPRCVRFFIREKVGQSFLIDIMHTNLKKGQLVNCDEFVLYWPISIFQHQIGFHKREQRRESWIFFDVEVKSGSTFRATCSATSRATQAGSM